MKFSNPYTGPEASAYRAGFWMGVSIALFVAFANVAAGLIATSCAFHAAVGR